MPNQTVAERVAIGDLSLFDALPAELTPADRGMLLALQSITAGRHSAYRYLEIGSHRGGSIQPHLLDRRCAEIISIDPRPASQPDERGNRFHYQDNSTKRMIADLSVLEPGQIAKVRTFDMTAAGVAATAQGIAANLIFVDGEHTDEAVQADCQAVLRLAAQGAMIVFHDAPIVYMGLGDCLRVLRGANRHFTAFPLPDTLFVVVLDDADPLARPEFAALRNQVGAAYLAGMTLNNGYRRFYRLQPLRLARSVLSRLGFGRFLARHQYGADSLEP
jgi:Methyltransferase domain